MFVYLFQSFCGALFDLSDAGCFAESVELLQVLIDAVDRAQHVSESVLYQFPPKKYKLKSIYYPT